jgi:hypothetical protein
LTTAGAKSAGTWPAFSGTSRLTRKASRSSGPASDMPVQPPESTKARQHLGMAHGEGGGDPRPIGQADQHQPPAPQPVGHPQDVGAIVVDGGLLGPSVLSP